MIAAVFMLMFAYAVVARLVNKMQGKEILPVPTVINSFMSYIVPVLVITGGVMLVPAMPVLGAVIIVLGVVLAATIYFNQAVPAQLGNNTGGSE